MSFALGCRKPSVVTNCTLGVFGQRVSIACSTRAVVDLPTATEPATPMMYGTLPSSAPRKRCVALKRPCVAAT